MTAGTQLTSLVPERQWIIANFKETHSYAMTIGQPVRFTVDALQNAQLSGRIEDFSPATWSEFSVAKSDSAIGNSQR